MVYFISGVYYSHILYPYYSHKYFVDFCTHVNEQTLSLMDEKFGTWRAMMPAVSWVMGCADFGNWFNTSNTNPAMKRKTHPNPLLFSKRGNLQHICMIIHPSKFPDENPHSLKVVHKFSKYSLILYFYLRRFFKSFKTSVEEYNYLRLHTTTLMGGSK